MEDPVTAHARDTWQWVSPSHLMRELMDMYAFHAAASQSPSTNDEVFGLIEEEISSLQYQWVIAWERYLRDRIKAPTF